MIKCDKGKVTISGTRSALRAEMTCLVKAFLGDSDLCEGKTKEERLEWFNENIVNLAYNEDKRSKAVQEAAQEIAKLLGKGADEILTGILKAMEAEAKDDSDDEEDDE